MLLPEDYEKESDSMKKVERAPGMGIGRAGILSQPQKTHHVISTGLFSQPQSYDD